jgi:phosphoribosyl 1,2-cyclic phosphodiesterase
VEVGYGDDALIFDAGTGIRALGNALGNRAVDGSIDILLSHCHIDHVMGLPFFAPLFNNDQVVRIWAGHLRPANEIEGAIRKLMSFPLFPLRIEDLRARVEFRDFRAGDTISVRSDMKVRTAPLNHPGGATGYRIDRGSHSVAYVTDVELGNGAIDPALLDLVADVSLLILDTTYTDQELPSHLGWGHSSWQQGVRLADAGGVRKLCLFHHDPEHDDKIMDAIATAANAARPGTIVASEGSVLDV